MTDTPQTTHAVISDKPIMTLHVNLGEANYCFITCDQHAGLLIAGPTIADALAEVVPVLRLLLEAGPAHPDPTAFGGIKELQP